MRTAARETVFQYLFSEFFSEPVDKFLEALAKNNKLSEKDFDFAKDLLLHAEEKKGEYLSYIADASENFKLDRIHVADKCALIIGMAEIDNYPDTPRIVVIDEAVKLAAKYSTEKSADFVNGIMANYKG